MRNLLFKIRYKGTAYHGYQVQQNAHTVTCELQNALERLLGRREDIVGCSRTDAGVHANAYCFNMKTENPMPTDRLCAALNALLPTDIAVLDCTEVAPDFHARYSCVGKEYVYLIHNAKTRDPFLEHLALHWQYPMPLDRLNDAARRLCGRQDFRAFSCKSDQVDTVRTLYRADFTRSGDLVRFTIAGDGFLYKMVRTVVGTLLQVSAGRLEPADVDRILQSRDRSMAGKTAAPDGLYLNRVFYSKAEICAEYEEAKLWL